MPFSYNTTKVPSSERLSYWHDVVVKHCIPALSDSDSEDSFDAELTGCSVGALSICRLTGPRHRWVRDMNSIRRGPEESLWLGYMENGTGYLEQNGNSVKTTTGDLVMYDAARPFVHAIHPRSMLVLRLPRELLSKRTSNSKDIMATKLGVDTGLGAVMASMMKEAMSPEMAALPPLAQARFASSMLDMVSALIEAHRIDREEESSYATLYRRALEHIEKNIEDEELSVDQMAHALRVSRRTLSRAMAVHGETPMKCVWQKRIEASYCAILEGNVRNVTEAAMMFGFCDLSHFSKTFKKSFGVTPQSLLMQR